MNRPQSSKPEPDRAPRLASDSRGDSQAADARTSLRDGAKLQTIVQIKDGLGENRREITNVTTISKNGAGFNLARPCTVGGLVTLVLPMPVELRVYDETERLYPVMGLVQYCNEGEVDGEKCHHVGVALIGKEVPESFKENPLQSYRITGMAKTGLWTIVETDTDFKARRQPRYWVQLDVTISLLQKEKKTVVKEKAVTQNVGTNGSAVKCLVKASAGDKVKFACSEFDFYTIAIVKSQKEDAGQPSTLHLEFLENEFPVEKLLEAMNRDLQTAGEGPRRANNAAATPTRADSGRV